MKSIKVIDLMVPLSEYATVSEDANLYEAVMALEEAQERFEDKHTRYRHRAILVLDKKGDVIGKVSQLDVLRALEPKYDQMLSEHAVSRFGFTREFMQTMLRDHQLFEGALDNICRKAAGLNVKKVMYRPTEGEYIDEEAGLDEAIHLLVLGRHQSLLVTRQSDGRITGILRLTDVFAAVFHLMKKCF